MHPFMIPMAVVAYTGLAIIIGLFGRNRTMGGWGYFFGSIVLTPIIGLLLLLASAPRDKPRRS
ncbi:MULTISPECIES: hypothetical protein [Thiorhodovibrio]|uniref:hypothetical protein n=1 Tax=Thiorhodovibrio TaxID=61593 RepID=UPI001912D472|nr:MULTISPECIES: hypothetical protein [Thiorhodovibrio]MBK5969264.1 hypothetical protein [Thiorhodovibrio winogradskyi]WPL11255.1 hypothetical protein Thiosp_00987 [Thiorhodovibrio litoralis]